ncbi:hypothetical protein [Methylotetracoccus oryzae]|uniref:hypothetical protein n=1 Tax=Methylotetracoccus oryzae TaxID=1919059 RepID=UPI00111A3FDD|nr:hypothetical protein [Methylotetracoccus oryzae]
MATITPEPAPQEPADSADTPRSVKRERLKREDPKRSGPIRNATTYFRDSHSWDEGAPDPDATAEHSESLAETLDDVITHGVHLGYKVIEEHILKGQRAARQLRQTRTEPGDGDGELDAFIEQAQRVYQDLGSLCFDALGTLTRSPALLRGLARAVQPAARADADPLGDARANPVGPATRVVVEVLSRQHARIDLRLDPELRTTALRVHALHAPGPDAPPLTAITLRFEPAHGTLVLDVRIPDRQVPGLYSGVVVDAETNDPAGTLTVRVAAEPSVP